MISPKVLGDIGELFVGEELKAGSVSKLMKTGACHRNQNTGGVSSRWNKVHALQDLAEGTCSFWALHRADGNVLKAAFSTNRCGEGDQ